MNTRTNLQAAARMGLAITSTLAMLALAPRAFAQATPLVKGSTGTDLSLPASWDGVNVPGATKFAMWNNVTNCLGGTLTINTASWAGINVSAATAGIVLLGNSADQTLSIGANGVTVSGKNLTFGSAAGPNPVIEVAVDQTWTINSTLKAIFNGATLSVNTAVTQGGWKIVINNTATGTSSGLDLNGGTKTYDLSKAEISGAGQFVVRNSDTVILGPNNSFTATAENRTGGDVTYSTLAGAGSNSSFGAGTGNLFNVNSNSTVVFTNTGAGGTTDRAVNVVALSAGNLTFINNGSGAVNFTSTAALGVPAAASKLILSGTYAGGSNTIAQAITAPVIEKSFDDSHWLLTNANTVSTLVDVKKGVLELGNASAAGTAPITLTNAGAELRIGGGLTISNNLSFTNGLSSTLSITSVTPATYSGNIALSSTFVSTGGTPANFRLSAAAGAKLTVSGQISGTLGPLPAGAGEVRYTGAGTVVVSGANIYTGPTIISAGTVVVSNTSGSATASGDVTVSNAGTSLAGTGTIAGNTTVSTGAVVAPGATPGDVSTLTFGGNLTINAASDYVVDATSATTCDKLAVTGILAVGDSITMNAVGHTFALGDTYDVADASSITGTPTVTPAIPAPGLAWDISAFNTTGVISVVEATNFNSWMGGYTFAPGADTTATGDADNDGIDNLVENVLGTAPNAASTGITQVSATGSSVTFQHPVNGTLATDVTYSYEWSTDMVNWTADNVANGDMVVVDIAPGAPVAGVVTVTATVTTGTTPTLFVRIKANQTAP